MWIVGFLFIIISAWQMTVDNAMDFAKLIVTVVVAIFGWLIAHYFSASRDRKNKQRDQRIKYLVEAFRLLSEVVHHPCLHEVNKELREALSIIQLFGTEQQNTLVASFVEQMRDRAEGQLDSLLQDLRDELRQELKLPELSEPICWLWVQPSSEVPREDTQLSVC